MNARKLMIRALVLLIVVPLLQCRSDARQLLVKGNPFKLCEEGEGQFQFTVHRAPDGITIIDIPQVGFVDEEGRYYVGDSLRRRTLVFANDGEALHVISHDALTSPALRIQWGARILDDGRILFVPLQRAKARCLFELKYDKKAEPFFEMIRLRVPNKLNAVDQTVSVDDLYLTTTGDMWYACPPGENEGTLLFAWDGEFIKRFPHRQSEFRKPIRIYREISTRWEGKRALSKIVIDDENGNQVGVVPGETYGREWFRGKHWFKYCENGQHVMRRFDRNGDVVEDIHLVDIDGLPRLVSPNGTYLASSYLKTNSGKMEIWVEPYHVRRLR